VHIAPHRRSHRCLDSFESRSLRPVAGNHKNGGHAAAPYRAQVAVATANVEQAEAAATNAKVTAARNRELSKQSLVSRRELDDAEALERSTGAALSAAHAIVPAGPTMQTWPLLR
jgi:multidrug resistance efflux pump